MIEIVDSPIDTGLVVASVESPRAGAVVLFLGTTREWTDGRRTQSLEYECYQRMAVLKLHELEMEARHRWNLIGCSLVHRIGTLEVGEASVAVAVSAPHRVDAFEAGQWLIDTLKQEVPIWKREHWADGSTSWIHPANHLSEDATENGELQDALQRDDAQRDDVVLETPE